MIIDIFFHRLQVVTALAISGLIEQGIDRNNSAGQGLTAGFNSDLGPLCPKGYCCPLFALSSPLPPPFVLATAPTWSNTLN